MKRRLMQLLFAIGLVLTLVVTTLWVRSFWATDRYELARMWVARDSAHMREILFLHANCFNFQFGWLREEVGPSAATFPTSEWHAAHDSDAPMRFGLWRDYAESRWEQFGFACWGERRQTRPWESDFNLCAPGWFIVMACAAFTALPTASLWRSRARMIRQRRGLCPACGYDLRGAAHERCPECGAVPDPGGTGASPVQA